METFWRKSLGGGSAPWDAQEALWNQGAMDRRVQPSIRGVVALGCGEPRCERIRPQSSPLSAEGARPRRCLLSGRKLSRQGLGLVRTHQEQGPCGAATCGSGAIQPEVCSSEHAGDTDEPDAPQPAKRLGASRSANQMSPPWGRAGLTGRGGGSTGGLSGGGPGGSNGGPGGSSGRERLVSMTYLPWLYRSLKLRSLGYTLHWKYMEARI